MPPSPPPVLVVNLDEAQQRWTNVVRNLGDVLPDSPIVRIRAVDVRRRSLDDADLPLSPLARWRMKRPPRRYCSYMVIADLSAVGCAMSHVHCWQWLADRPETPYALILEDDCCLPRDTFASEWARGIAPLLALEGKAAAFDFLVLDYRRALWEWMPGRDHRPTDLGPGGLRVYARMYFLGSHCYLVSQAGARRLLRRAYPLEMPLDWYLSVAMNLGRVRGFVVVQPIANSCLRHAERTNFTHGPPAKWFLPDPPVYAVALSVVAVLLAVLLVHKASKRTKNHHD